MADHNPWLVILSVLVGMVAAYGTYACARFMTLVDDRSAPLWIGAGALTMGTGIWTLHFVAMLAFEPGASVGYDPAWTVFSWSLAVAASALALALLWRRPLRSGLRLLVAVMLTAGIGAMHYTGMRAMDAGAVMHHPPGIVAASLAWSALFAYASLRSAYPAGALRAPGMPAPQHLPLAAALLGVAVAGLHYIGMAGMAVEPRPGVVATLPMDNRVLAILAIAGMLLISFMMLWLTASYRWHRSQLLLADRERMLRNLLAHLPVMVFQAKGPELDRMHYISDGAERLTGYPAASFARGEITYEDLVLDEDRPGVVEARRDKLRGSYAHAYRLRHRDGTIRWIRELGNVGRDQDGKPVADGVAEDYTERKQLEEQLTRDAIYDHLTGVMNRSGIEKLLDDEMRKSDRLGYPLTVLMVDVDYFKPINDQFGHDTGDRVLKEVAEVIAGSIRRTDHAARWGGEEFMIALPGTPLDHGHHLAEKLRVEIAARRFAGFIDLTVSIGVVQYESGQSLRQMAIRADQALYEAKNAGRNAVKVA